MALAVNAIMTFRDYAPEDTGVRMHFVCSNPGGGEVNDYYILLTDAELGGVSSQAALRTLVTTKLQRRFRAQGFTAKLDPFIGQTITI